MYITKQGLHKSSAGLNIQGNGVMTENNCQIWVECCVKLGLECLAPLDSLHSNTLCYRKVLNSSNRIQKTYSGNTCQRQFKENLRDKLPGMNVLSHANETNQFF